MHLLLFTQYNVNNIKACEILLGDVSSLSKYPADYGWVAYIQVQCLAPHFRVPSHAYVST